MFYLTVGDPMLLHRVIRSKHLDMTSLEKLTQQELRSICEECKIEKVSSLSKVVIWNIFNQWSIFYGKCEMWILSNIIVC